MRSKLFLENSFALGDIERQVADAVLDGDAELIGRLSRRKTGGISPDETKNRQCNGFPAVERHGVSVHLDRVTQAVAFFCGRRRPAPGRA